MNYLGLDLGTKTLGVSICDNPYNIVTPYTTIKFNFEDYDKALEEVLNIIKEKNISLVVLGLPKNMDGSLGFASERSIKFKELLNKNNINVELEDERLTSVMAENIIHNNNFTYKKKKDKIDAYAASIILESYLGRKK